MSGRRQPLAPREGAVEYDPSGRGGGHHGRRPVVLRNGLPGGPDAAYRWRAPGWEQRARRAGISLDEIARWDALAARPGRRPKEGSDD